jgi:catechol 2,3-dioxygenase-like lactoylglutathione lyase family enzyme
VATVSVRYIVNDVDDSIDFYCHRLGFSEVMHPAPGFAMLERGDLRLVLSSPGTVGGGGGQAMPDGRMPAPGGWNRFAIEVTDLDTLVEVLRESGTNFRNDIPIELFEPTIAEARLDEG